MPHGKISEAVSRRVEFIMTRRIGHILLEIRVGIDLTNNIRFQAERMILFYSSPEHARWDGVRETVIRQSEVRQALEVA